MTRQKWLLKWLPIFLPIGLSVFAAWQQVQLYNLQVQLYDLQVQGTRADLSILVNPSLNQNWTFFFDGVYFTVNGTLSNEGARTATVLRLEVAMIHEFSDGDTYTLTRTFLDAAKECSWNNNTISTGEIKHFSVTVLVHKTIALNSHTGELLPIGLSGSDRFSVRVIYDDGKGNLTTTKEYSSKE